jgi:hypothetical protein
MKQFRIEEDSKATTLTVPLKNINKVINTKIRRTQSQSPKKLKITIKNYKASPAPIAIAPVVTPLKRIQQQNKRETISIEPKKALNYTDPKTILRPKLLEIPKSAPRIK